LEVTLEFGFYPGVVEGTCGEEAKVCDELEISEEQGEQLKYLGEKIEVREESKIVEIGKGKFLFFWYLCRAAYILVLLCSLRQSWRDRSPLR